ncbi:pentatricopeptide repeat-containing protein At1g73400, mitochondrial-like [Prosopis cineraria]|uniref:pentatricopeptide repeat-containing protein At1g73400, mitochondrial-like n=1 Tax=Prosopis cineraria TaxID=364024 RepID=UPI00240F971E|nr:pentatricopeptide repeat-containing protein At1g73400, mitochondrial-like [Prosopis cineraria]XP_054821373.1 pentatricopeptide repeat-containing protein At1g73400, mitochondrial-like [Prosopis cineraria]XP_054821374.1 pentatricopeptide repeat-containing protein At1g73400, mitochondrial-like [Prosopis cineraria]XP_054821375.1 pentatricopeptide repeat-containing protein At1g73400, mitochondrial-like [Prosopis cineraria]XP_054821376.1 pentatricopeptide repeat-containing protein At1g73400, mitoc
MGRFDKYIYSLKFRFSSLCAFDYIFRSQGPSHNVTLLQSPTMYFSRYSTYHHMLIQVASCSCMRFIKSSLPMNLFVTHGISMRLYCSEAIPTDRSLDSSNVEDHRLESDIEKIYSTIMDKSIGHNNTEKALDRLGIPLSTPLVTGILKRLHFEEKMAFRFFTWAGHQENYSHEFCAYNDMIDILSSTRYKVRQFRIVCDMLDYMKRHNKDVVPVEVLLTILRKYTEKYLTHVQKFAKKKRIRVKTQPEINAFNLLLDALCKCSLAEEAEGLFKKVQSKIKPNADTYNILFFGWCRVRNPTRGMKVLEDMIQCGHIPDNFTYNTAIDTFCKEGMLKEALELFEFMRTKGSTISSPTAKTYAIIIVALVQNDRMEDCFKLLECMISSGCLPDVSTYKDIIQGMSLFGKIELAYKFLEEMGNKGYPPDIVTYNCFLKVLCDNKKSDEALRLYGNMIDLGCLPSVQTYNMLTSMFFKMGDPDAAFETWHEMTKRGCAPDRDSYCVMIDGLFRYDKVEDACFLLEEVINKGIKLPFRKFDTILMHLSVIGNLQFIHRLSDHMRKFYNTALARRYALGEKRKSASLRGK